MAHIGAQTATNVPMPDTPGALLPHAPSRLQARGRHVAGSQPPPRQPAAGGALDAHSRARPRTRLPYTVRAPGGLHRQGRGALAQEAAPDQAHARRRLRQYYRRPRAAVPPPRGRAAPGGLNCGRGSARARQAPAGGVAPPCGLRPGTDTRQLLSLWTALARGCLTLNDFRNVVCQNC